LGGKENTEEGGVGVERGVAIGLIRPVLGKRRMEKNTLLNKKGNELKGTSGEWGNSPRTIFKGGGSAGTTLLRK